MLSVPNRRKTLAGLTLDQSWTVTIQKQIELHSVGLFKKLIFLYYLKNRIYQIKVQKWLPKKLLANAFSF